MKSGWFWQTPMWQAYLQEYAKTRRECLHEWKSSPLANDHDFTNRKMNATYLQDEHLSQVIDLRTHKWSDIRKSYRGLINQANKRMYYFWHGDIFHFSEIHRSVFGNCRNDETYKIQEHWIRDGYALCVTAMDQGSSEHVAAALWIVYKECAYYASGPSLQNDVQHALIYNSLLHLRKMDIRLVELGQIDGETEKEKNIGKFKAGFGGEPKPFTIVRRMI